MNTKASLFVEATPLNTKSELVWSLEIGRFV